MLDIAIGIIFIYLLLSVFATAINEIILSKMNMRGKELLRGIATLLSDPQLTGLAKDVYNHGQVYGLFDGELDLKDKSNLPAYIPARNFALALLSSVDPHFGVAPPPPAPAGALAPEVAAQPVAPAGAAAAVHATIAVSQAFKDAAAGLAANPVTEKVGKPLLSMVAMAGNDANKLQRAVEDWYNSSMDRVSGWYKYRTQWVLFAIGCIMAVGLNANTLAIVHQLSKDSTMRQSIVAAAQSYKPAANNPAPSLQDQMQAARDSVGGISDIGIPIGWRGVPDVRSIPGRLHSNTKHFLAQVFDRTLGWLLTAIAISLGAPFWFDALNKIMVVRSTVKPREKSPDEPSKS